MSTSGPASAFESETFGQDASFHLEQPIGSMSIAPSGRDLALASKEGLHIIDLDSPYSPPRYLPHRTPWEVADVQWSPFASRDYWVVSTSNQKALVWNLGAKSWQDTIEFVLHGHMRAITDINFSAHNPDILATCAVDSFVHCWDLRVPARPAFSFSDWFAGATQVKWSRQDEHVLASSHDRSLHIWDARHGAYPVRTIEAHSTKIYGIDWNRFEPHKIVTCSLDRRVKFWNLQKDENKPDRTIETGFPVWRARHTPFGWGIVALPQRGSSELPLYDRRERDGHYEPAPVAKFSGHDGQVKEFLWRARGNIVDGIDQRDFQLISWGTDRKLRLHLLDPDALAGIGYEKGVSKTHRLNFTRRGAKYRTFRDLPDEASSPIDSNARTESLPSQYQMLSLRNRRSTTVGMSKLNVSQVRGWAASKDKSSRNAMHGKSHYNNDINPIAWLKNVKIGAWDPDALAEEVRHVGDIFKNVDFEVINIKHRKVVVALQAPWKEHQHAIYLRIDIRFPQAYPRGASAVMTVQKTSNMEDELFQMLSVELHEIAEVYATQHRGCLEAVFRYLLREQSLEQIVTWARGDTLTESRIFGPELPPADESSDSDDDHLEGMGTTLASNANVRVPLAKGCGALWSECGKLVCFFPPKPTETDVVLGGLSYQDFDKSESSQYTSGFGQLMMSPPRKGTNGTKTADSGSSSETDDSLSDSSSSLSSSSGPIGELPSGLQPNRKYLPGFQQQPHSVDFSNRSTTMAGARTSEGSRKTIVSLLTFDDLQPARKELAERYQIFGASEEVCKHNAEVARFLYRPELESVWNLAAMVLSKTVPLNLVSNPAEVAGKDILVIAEQATLRLGRKDSGVGLHGTETKNDMRAQLKWGYSPMAAGYLIPAMFDYFDCIGDIQMLGMLSCIFAKASHVSVNPRASSAAIPQNPNGYYPSITIAESILRPDAETDGFIWVEPMSPPRSLPQLSTSDEQTVLDSRRATTVSVEQSGLYQNEPGGQRWSRAPSMSVEDGQSLMPTPTSASLSTSPEGNRMLQRASTSLSHAQASLSALTQSFSHSPPAPSSMSVAPASLKKYSPSGSLTPSWNIFSAGHGSRASRSSMHYSESSSGDKDSALRSSASHGNFRGFRRDGRMTPDIGRHSVRSLAPSEASDSTRRVDMKGKRKRTIQTSLRNQNRHDLDGHVSVPLLDPKLEWKYKRYRATYAALLEVWQLPVARAKVLKIDGQLENDANGSSPVSGSRRKTFLSDAHADDEGLRIRRTCQSCDEVLAAIEKNAVAIGWHCVNPGCRSRTRKISKRSVCTICCQAVSGLCVPCLQCGHLACYECAQGWFGTATHDQQGQKRDRRTSSKSTLASVKEEPELGSAPSTSLDDSEDAHSCPTGCGCTCSTITPTSVSVPFPHTAIAQDAISTIDTATPHFRPQDLTRTPSSISQLSNATSMLSSAGSTDTALASFFGLTKSRPQSQALKSEPSPPKESDELAEERLLNPFAVGNFGGLGKGIGGGLSRGLGTTASATARGKMARKGSGGSGSTVRRVGEG